MDFNVAGISFRKAAAKRACESGDRTVRIVPEPGNPHDPNALRVEIARQHVGYVPRNMTDRIGALLLRGARPRVERAGPFHAGYFAVIRVDDKGPEGDEPNFYVPHPPK